MQLHLEFDMLMLMWYVSNAWLFYFWLFPAFYSHHPGQGLYSEHTQLQIFLQLHQIPTAGSTIEGIMRRKSRHLISCPRCLQRCSQHCRRVLFLCWRQFTVKCDVLCNSGNCTLRAGNEVWLSERADAYRPLWLITSACWPNTPCAPLTPPREALAGISYGSLLSNCPCHFFSWVDLAARISMTSTIIFIIFIWQLNYPS